MVDKEEKETTEGEKPEDKTPTAEERLVTLEEKLTKSEKERDEFKTGLSTAHSRLTERDKELKKQVDIDTRLNGFDETQRILAAMVNEKLTSGDLDGEQKTDYLKKFDEISQRQKAEIDQAAVKAQQDEDYQKRDDLWTKAQTFGTYDENDDVADIYDALREGKAYKAERIIKKLEKSQPDKENKVEGTEDERFTKRLEEEKRKWMEENDLLKNDDGTPSAAEGSWDDVRKKFAENSNDPAIRAKYLEMRKERGL